MSVYSTIKRLMLIVEKLNTNKYVSVNEMLNYLQIFDFNISTRTLQRDIEQLKNEFGFEIKYSKKHNGYFLENANDESSEVIFKLFETITTSQTMLEAIKETHTILPYIKFENEGLFKGSQWIYIILKAIKENKKLQFNHFNFHNNTHKVYLTEPYLLKEYQGRWYVICFVKSLNDFRIFGLDRISELNILNEQFQPIHKKQAQSLFEHTIGLDYDSSELKKVVLSFTPTQGKYIKSLPLHASQKILVDNEKELIIELLVYINFELKQKLFMQLDTVTVLEPAELRQEMKQIAQNIIDNHN